MPTIDADSILGTFRNTGTGTNAGVTVSSAGVATQRKCITDLSGSGDLACLVTVESPAGTVIWRKRFAGAFVFSESFEDEVFVGAEGDLIQAKISASTANCELNIGGYLRD